MRRKDFGKCTNCGKEIKPKIELAIEILEAVGYKGEKSRHMPGDFTAGEMRVVYEFIMKATKTNEEDEEDGERKKS